MYNDWDGHAKYSVILRGGLEEVADRLRNLGVVAEIRYV
jgi:hypothetical protein